MAGWLALATGAQAQTTNILQFEVGVVPTNGTLLVTDSTNAVYVTITNAASFTNLTVVGAFAGQTNLAFLDAGAAPDRTAGDGTFSGFIATPLVTQARPELLTLVITGEEPPMDPPVDPPPAPVVATNEVEYVVVLGPPNDHFVNAWKFEPAGGLQTSSNNFASLERSEPRHGGLATAAASIWWNWYPSANTNVLVDLAGTAFDAVLAVYTGSSVSNLTPVVAATNDIVNHLRAHVNFNATVGKTYRIAVAGVSSNVWGDVRIRVVPGASADTSGPVVSITSPASQSSVLTSNIFVTGTAKERLDNETGVSQVLVQVNNSTNLVVADGTTDWSAVVGLPPGTNLVRAFGVDIAGNRGVPATVVVRYLDPPNDLFSNAEALDPNGGWALVSTRFAGKEPGEPFHAGNEGGRSIWYRWQAPLSGELYLDTSGSDFDTLLAVYVGNGVDSLLELASNDDAFSGSEYSALSLRVVANQVYYIAVDGVGAASGDAALYHSFATSQTLYGLFVTPPLGGVVLPTETLYAPGAAVNLWAIADRNYVFVRWLTAGGDPVSFDNPLPLVMNQNYSFQAEFRVVHYSDTFRNGTLSGTLPWVSPGASAWYVTMVDGQSVARSGAVGDGQSSSLVLATNLYAGTGSFDLKVSSEAGWDWLEFYVNGSRLNRWSGEVPWQSYQFAIAGGTTTLEWRYLKDNNFTAGADAAYIDNVYVTLERPATSTTQPNLSLVRLGDGRIQLGVVGVPGISYVVQRSPDLSSWSPAVTNAGSAGAFQWIDPDPPVDRRYYRAVAP